mgnify:CR=1 FL=1
MFIGVGLRDRVNGPLPYSRCAFPPGRLEDWRFDSGRAAEGAENRAMIDPKSGAMMIEGLAEAIGPKTSLKRFLELSGLPKPDSSPSPMSNFWLGQRRAGGRLCEVRVQYCGNDVEMIEFPLAPAEVAALNKSSETDAEMCRHDLQRQWLISILGPPTHPSSVGNDTHAFTMGGVGSCYDPRNDLTTIIARYRWLGKPWYQAQE